MSMLQIKNFPDDLKERLSARAREEGTTMSALVVDIVWRELEMPTMKQWWAHRSLGMENEPVVDTTGVVEEMRDQFERTGDYY